MAVIGTPLFSFFPLRAPVWQKVLVLVAFAAVLDGVGVGQWWVSQVSRPIVAVKQGWARAIGGVATVAHSVQKLPRSAQRIQDLELRAAEASAALAELETLRAENEELRFLLENTDRSVQRTHLTAPIIAFSRPAVGIGSRAGVVEGAMVVSRNTLLGQISNVSEYEARVVLLLEGEASPVLARTESGAEGLVMGDGRRVLFTQVPKDVPLAVGERIVTLGQPQIGQNIPIGRIVKVENDPVQSVQSAIVEQSVSFYEAPLVEVY